MSTEQEYDASDMLDDVEPAADDPDSAVSAYAPPLQGPGPGQPFPGGPMSARAPFDPAAGAQQAGLRPATAPQGGAPPDGVVAPAMSVDGAVFDPYDPMLDADPFGLSASMHFPTHFSFQESSMRK